MASKLNLKKEDNYLLFNLWLDGENEPKSWAKQASKRGQDYVRGVGYYGKKRGFFFNSRIELSMASQECYKGQIKLNKVL